MWKDRSAERPKLGSKVLVYNGSIYLATISWDGIAQVQVGFEWVPVEQFNHWTHWMELPDAPVNTQQQDQADSADKPHSLS